MTALLLAVILGGAIDLPPGGADAVFSSPPAVEMWVSEDWPLEDIHAARGVPGARLAIATRSNMLRPSLVAYLKHRPALVRLSSPLLPPHVELLRKLPNLSFLLAVPAAPTKELASRVASLGPQPLRFAVAELDEPRAAFLERMRSGEMELDLRGRVPNQEELARLLRLTNLRLVVRLSAGSPPDIVKGLAGFKLARIVVEASDDRVPGPLLEALADQPAEVRVVVDTAVGVEDIRRLASLPKLSFELHAEKEAALPRRIPELFQRLTPAAVQGRK